MKFSLTHVALSWILLTNTFSFAQNTELPQEAQPPSAGTTLTKVKPDISLVPQIGDQAIESLKWSEDVGAVWSNPETQDGLLLGILLKISFPATLSKIQINEGPFFSAKELSEFKFVLRLKGMQTEGRIRVEYENGDSAEQKFLLTIANWEAIKKMAQSSPLVLSKLQYKFGAFLSDLEGYDPFSQSTGTLLSKLSLEGNLLASFNDDRSFQPYADLQFRYISFNPPASRTFTQGSAKLLSIMIGLEKIYQRWTFVLESGIKPTLFYRAETSDKFKIEHFSRLSFGSGISTQYAVFQKFLIQPKVSIFWSPPKRYSQINFNHDLSFLFEGNISFIQSSNLKQYSLLPFVSQQLSQSSISDYSRLEYGLKIQYKQLYY